MDAASSTQGGTPPAPSQPAPATAAAAAVTAAASKPPRAAVRPPQAPSNKIARDSDTQKYKIKYKDLKVKVREIERDNDKLALRILRAKRDVQRVRLERAIIFERLAIPLEHEPQRHAAAAVQPQLAPAAGEPYVPQPQ